ncbi:MAG TPA: hypothetical protein VFV35_02090, partial [Acidimicrobiales bacterium]|nr:hypothetical protein [Acidimicrobiales bacterium]
MRSPRRTSTVRLVALFALVGVASLAALTFTTLSLSDAAVRNQAERRVRALAQVTAALARADVEKVEGVLAAYAGRARLEQAIQARDDGAIRRQIDELTRATPWLAGAAVVGPDGAVAVTGDGLPPPPRTAGIAAARPGDTAVGTPVTRAGAVLVPVVAAVGTTGSVAGYLVGWYDLADM